MTEDEAKTKACCSGARRPQDNGPCIASSCMAWQWAGYRAEDGKWVRVAIGAWKYENAEGYCGLAGVQQ